MHYLRTAIATFASVLVSSLLAYASTPGPVGVEFAVEDRELPAWGWWTHCEDLSGVRATLLPECRDEDCHEPAPLVLERTNPRGELVAPPLRVTEAPAVLTYFRVTCRADGLVLAQWRDVEEGCYVHREIEADGAMPAPAKRTAAMRYDCRARPSVALRWDGSFVAAWGAAHLGSGSGVIVQAFDPLGDPATDPVSVTEDAIGWNRQPKIAVDGAGTALVAWIGDGAATATGTEPILARFLDVDATPIGATMRVDTFGYGHNAPPVVTADARSEFTVAWSNPFQGGRVARRVSLRPTPVQDVQSLPVPASGLPRFGAARTLDSWRAGLDELEEHAAGLTKTPLSPWVMRSPAGFHQLSDDGVAWSAPEVSGAGSDRAVAFASDESGMVLVEGSSDSMLYVARSDGDAWSNPVRVAPVVLDGRACDGCRLTQARLAPSGDARSWIAVWGVTNANGKSSRVYAVASRDGGKSWGKVRTVAENSGGGANGLDLRFAPSGTVVIVWSDRDLHAVRSNDGGSSWSATVSIAKDVACPECSYSRRRGRVEIAEDAGAWVVAFVASRYRTDTFGFDGDVFVSRSIDDGRSWSVPAPVVADARTDGWRDMEASIATDGKGRWLCAWASHRPIDEQDTMDPDVMVAVSADAGLTWSAPAPARRPSDSTSSLDWNPFVAAGDEQWMLVWQRRSYGLPGVEIEERILSASADATCGNSAVEAGEACDDGNVRDGDRCDSNCTRPGCGNGIVDRGEECDDGNHRDDDACLRDCRVAHCGDGVVQTPAEECDDGNTDDGDECPSSCRVSYCGDGVVQTSSEECDDGNGQNSDACVEGCLNARCGDGHVQDYVEACDDGNDIDDDACPNSCDRAVCGDGHTSKGFEACDPADPFYREICSDDCRLLGICGDADGDGAVSVLDVQRILGRAVFLPIRCPREVCDMDGSGKVVARDARIGVSAAVGLDVGTRCSIGTGNIVFWIDQTVEIGALQLEIDYSASGGSFPGSGANVECEVLARGVDHVDEAGDADPDAIGFIAFNNVEERKQLIVAMISAPGFSGPMDLFRCAFVLPEERDGARFEIRPMDASDVDFNPIVPFPMLGYRLE